MQVTCIILWDRFAFVKTCRSGGLSDVFAAQIIAVYAVGALERSPHIS